MNRNLNAEKLVLVTGGTGFIAIHCILQLLKAGYRVRTTLRDVNRAAAVLAMLDKGGAAGAERLTFIQADLSNDIHWDEAVKDCTYVLHIASPTPKLNFTHPDEMIVPAREGVLRVLHSAREAGVQRVVLTSAIGAIVYGHEKQFTPYDETFWTDTTHAPAYQKSKTLAEKAAWEFIACQGGGLELSVINPATVMGPVLGPDYSHSIYLVKNLLTGRMAGCPKINSCFVDVRDVADLHLRAMVDPNAKGERFIATGGESIWLVEVAKILKAGLGHAAEKVKVRQLPNALLRIAALTDPMVKSMIPLLGIPMNLTSAKAIDLLGWAPRSAEEAIVATAESLIRLNLL